ncbi:hypothetical protein H8E88_18750, partial [candidate division KSB1 bacterium]|nr:hypothetical protein [candidate division KSB1 bacterium]
MMENDLDTARKLLAQMDAAYPKDELTLLAHVLIGEDINIFKQEEPDEGEGFTSEDVPTEFSLNPANPNPFNPTTAISFALPVDAHVRLKIYDALGREVQKLLDQPKAMGNHNALKCRRRLRRRRRKKK